MNKSVGRAERVPGASLNRVVGYLRHSAAPPGYEPDAELLRRFVARAEGAAFEGLVRRHGPMVLGVCRRVLSDLHDAEDAFQATFLVLARKAGSVRQPNALGNWLYGVAYRVALKTRTTIALRRAVTGDLVEKTASSDPVAEAAWHELRPLLDEELSRLPDKYRAPLVLCYLEGKTNEEAARLLGWTKGTVSGRLARARDLLRPRLSRRGLTLSAAGLATLLGQNAALGHGLETGLSAALVDTTVRWTLTGGTSIPVTAVAEGVMRAMFLTQMKMWTALVLTLGLVTGAGVLWHRAPSAGADEVLRSAPPGADDKVPAKDKPGVLFTVPDDPKAETDEVQRLQGTWQAIALERNGETLSADAAKKLRLVILNNTITFNADGAKRAASFKVGPGEKPKAIWLTPLDETDKAAPVRGIYALEDGRLKLCVDNDEGKATPTEFAAKPGSGLTLIVLERVADGEKVVEAKAIDQALQTLIGSGAPVRSVAFSADSGTVFACAEDGSVYFWDAASGKVRAKVMNDGYTCRSLAVSRDGKLVAVAGVGMRKSTEVGTVWVFQAATGKLLMTLDERGETTNAIVFSPDGRTLVCAGTDGIVRIFDVASGQRRHAFRADVTAVAFSPDGKLLATGSGRWLTVWDASTGKEIRGLSGHEAQITAVQFSPDGKRMLTASMDGSVRIWDVETGKEVRRVDAHKAGVHSAAFSPDGLLLATAGADGKVRVWDLALGRQVSVFSADAKQVNSVAFSPNGKTIVSGGADGSVRIWAR
jgi:RNA polymerase sigma-70 factor (ECF subfamily)